jgi:hypothetical protein
VPPPGLQADSSTVRAASAQELPPAPVNAAPPSALPALRWASPWVCWGPPAPPQRVLGAVKSIALAQRAHAGHYAAGDQATRYTLVAIRASAWLFSRVFILQDPELTVGVQATKTWRHNLSVQPLGN